MQEIIWETRPQVIVETGFARGGSVVLYSTILELIGEGTVVSVDIDIRDHNRRAVEEHPMGHRVRFVEGSSTEPETVARVRDLIPDDARVMVVLDSDHSHAHVLDELRLYGPLVSPGQFLVVSDTIVEDIPPQSHRPRHWGPGDNPKTALEEYLRETDRFEPDPWFNGKLLVTSSRGGYLRCKGHESPSHDDATVPPVTIGMPVFNGAGTSRKRCAHCSHQTYGTSRWLSRTTAPPTTPQRSVPGSANDSRISYVRQEWTLASGNFEYLLHQARSPFFMWAATTTFALRPSWPRAWTCSPRLQTPSRARSVRTSSTSRATRSSGSCRRPTCSVTTPWAAGGWSREDSVDLRD